MYDVQRIQDGLMGLVGLRQTNDPNFTRLTAALTKTATNVLIQHPLLNIENLDMTSRNYSEWVYPTWLVGTTYAVGDRITDGTKIYDSLQAANIGNVPASSPAYWQEVTLLSLYLEDIFRNSIDEVVNSVVTAKKLRREAKTLLREMALYEGVGSMNDLIVNEGALVGFKIRLVSSRNLAAIIEKIGTQFTGTGNLDLWLYHSSQKSALATITLTRTKAYSFEWGTAGKLLQNVTDTLDAGGTFYLVYDQSQATGQALRRKHVWSAVPCLSCSNYNYNAYNQYSKFLTIEAIKVPSNKRNLDPGNPDFLWDIDQMQITQDTNFGLNLMFTVRCDLTDFLLQQKDVFAFAIRDMATVKMLESMSNSTRQNNLNEKVKAMATIALQNGSVGGGGIRQSLQKQIDAVDFEFSGFNDVCLPVSSTNGLQWGATSLNV